MKLFPAGKIKKKIENFDIFALGNSVFLYLILIFSLLPIAVFLRLPSETIKYIINQKVAFFGWEVFFYLILAVFSLIGGYYLFAFKKISQKFSFGFQKEWQFKNVGVVFLIIFIFGWLIKLIRILNGGYSHLNKNIVFTNSVFYSLVGLLDWLSPIALAIAFIYYFHLLKIGNFHYKTWQWIAWGSFVLEFVYGFFSGSRFSVFVPVVTYLISKHYLINKSYKRVIRFAILATFILMPFLNFYRTPQNLYNYVVNIPIEEAPKVFGIVIRPEFKTKPLPISHQEYVSVIKSDGILKFIVESVVSRLGQSAVVAAVFEKTDKFLNGKNLLGFFISLGPPRFIWNDKPIINGYGNEFARAYGLIASDDYKTSVGPTIVGDWYMNFGFPGIIFGMLFMGILFRLIYEYLIKRAEISLSGLMIYSIIWIQVIKGTEDWIAPVYAGLVKIFIILLIIHFFLIKKFKS